MMTMTNKKLTRERARLMALPYWPDFPTKPSLRKRWLAISKEFDLRKLRERLKP